MNRTFLSLIFVIALLGVQGMSLHAHLPHAEDEHTAVPHNNLHIHSHVVDERLDADHDHPDAVPIDLLTSALSRDHLMPSLDVVFQAVLILALMVIWVCIQRLPPLTLLINPPPRRLRKPSPRAPPC